MHHMTGYFNVARKVYWSIGHWTLDLPDVGEVGEGVQRSTGVAIPT